ncbi:MAG TPA: formate--tetrahydrofolate ligase [Rhizomicrobium sp.]|jgi:formate--tetrahydrofolate ligase|nr:formate--tetrahydrofolate ligase [Rhizomicrobium sp.]
MNDVIGGRRAATDWEIAQDATLLPIQEIAAKLAIPSGSLEPFGHYKAKIGMDFVERCLAENPDGKLILVTAINPTPAGEGKTTTTVGLGDALNRKGKKTAICLREPSLGPCFGMKGGAAGGGYSQVVPMDELNLHFTGDFHAIGVANNLLAAMLDNHIYWGNALDIDARRITWRRCLDMNDRALRSIVSSLGGAANGFPREDGFDITVASEVMAILCLSTSLQDLERRLANIIVASSRDRVPVRASDLKAQGAMTATLKDAIKPNLVQTLENNPVFVHGGPFANIAHGCNSVLATKLALKLADFVVTEAGFGADLGAEKFFDIKCRKAGLSPALAVVVVTVRALKFHGGVARKDLGPENVPAVVKGLANLERHIENIRKFGVPPVVALNYFAGDTKAELDAIVEGARRLGVQAVVCRHWAEGGAGAKALADVVIAAIDQGAANFHTLYPDSMKPLQKIETIAFQIYHAGEVVPSKQAADRLAELERLGFGHLPVCIAKTQYSNSADPEAYGAPTGHVLPLREVRLCAGAEFIVAICGDIMTMPGLPRLPSAESIMVNERGHIVGLS